MVVSARNSLVLDDEYQNPEPYKQPEECDFDSLNIQKKCFWVDNWHLILAGFVIPIVTLFTLNRVTGIFEAEVIPE